MGDHEDQASPLFPTVDVSGQRPTLAQFEERIRVVETLIVLGRASNVEQVATGLAAAGHGGLCENTLRKYLSIARGRLLEADEPTRKARQETVLRRILQADMDLAAALKMHNVAPSWSDRLAMLKFIRDTYFGGPGDAPLPGLPAVPAEGEAGGTPSVEEKKQADDLLEDMLKRSRNVLGVDPAAVAGQGDTKK